MATIVPRGYFSNEKYHPPENIERENYYHLRILEMMDNNYKGFQPYNSSQLIHLERIDTLDFYPLDMRRGLSLFLKYYGEGALYVIQGFRSPQEIGIAVHASGLAIDIVADNYVHARKICNAAYRAGFPNVVLGGNYDTQDGFVHLDLCPHQDFAYDAGIYGGPGSRF